MSTNDCVIQCGSFAWHNLQILTGYSLLGGKVYKDQSLPDLVVVAKVAGKKIAYDTLDAWFPLEKRGQYYAVAKDSDYYFKRSCIPNKDHLGVLGTKVRPLAPNYLCYNDEIAAIVYKGILGKMRRLKQGSCNYKRFECLETKGGNGRIIFLTRLWDPDAPDIQSEESATDRENVNNTRKRIIRELKSEYGKYVLSGVYADSYAIRTAPDIVINRATTFKPLYLREMQRASVCISSRGLHHSNGWKFGEYIAAGRAIVTERTIYEVPYSVEGDNYLVYDDVEGCMQCVERLMTDRSLRIEMQESNRLYYSQHLRPDMIILDTLKAAGVDCSYSTYY